VEQKLLQSFSNLADSVIAGAPKFLIGVLLVIAGFIAAKVVEIILRYLIRGRFRVFAGKAGSGLIVFVVCMMAVAQHAILQSDGHEISVANGAFLDSVTQSWPVPE